MKILGRIFIWIILFLVNLSLAASPLGSAKQSQEETEAYAFLEEAEKELHESAKKYTIIEWAYASNITDYNEEERKKYNKIADAISLRLGEKAKSFKLDQLKDKDLRRKIKSISQIGTSVLKGNDLDRYIEITSQMEKIYSVAKVNHFDDPSKQISLEPEITLKMAESRNPKELEYYWLKHRDTTGKKMRNMYKEYVKLTNKAARMNGFKDGTQMKIVGYESVTFVQEMADTWNGLKPLYEQLHAYVRYKLNKKYGNKAVDPFGPIPAHLLGNMWSQSWSNIADLVMPYPDKPSIDVTEEMKKQGWTPKIMFQKADEFFVSIGMDPMIENFWKNSIIEKPEGRLGLPRISLGLLHK